MKVDQLGDSAQDLSHSRRGQGRRIRLHRTLLQSKAAALDARLSQSNGVRNAGPISLGWCLRNRVRASRLRRSYPQGRETRRFAGAEPNQIRISYQSQDRQSARHRSPCDAARPRGRGNRITDLCWICSGLELAPPGNTGELGLIPLTDVVRTPADLPADWSLPIRYSGA